MALFSMLPAVAILISAICATFAALFVGFFPRLGVLDCAFIAPSLGLSLSAWLVLALKTVPGAGVGISPLVITATIIIQCGIVAACWRRMVAGFKAHRADIFTELRLHRVPLIVLSVLAIWWTYMSHIHYLFKKGNDYYAGGSVYADLPFHTNVASSFVNGANERAGIFSTLMSTFFAGAPLAYPFIPDFYIGVLVAAGMDWHESLSSTGGVLLASLTALAYLLNANVTRSSRAGLFSILLAVCTGGLGAWYHMKAHPDWWTPFALTSSSFIHGPDHVLYWEGHRSAFWFAMCAHILFPQRTVQHAYPLALAALLLVWKGVQPAKWLTGSLLSGSKTSSPKQIVGPSDDAAVAPVVEDEAAISSSVNPASIARRRNVPPSGRSGTTVATEDDVGGQGYATSPTGATGIDEATAAFLWDRGVVDGGSGAFFSQMRLFALAGLVTGLLPLMQPHSFVTVGTIVLLMAVGHMLERAVYILVLGRSPNTRGSSAACGARVSAFIAAAMEWVAYGVVALSLGLPQLYKHFAHRIGSVGERGPHTGFVRYSPAWVEEGKGKGPIATWWEATGLFLPLFLVSVLLLRRPAQFSLFAGLIVLFLVAHYIMFQPWHWDNTKLLCCWIFPASGYVGYVLDNVLTATGSVASWTSPKLTLATTPSASSTVSSQKAKTSTAGMGGKGKPTTIPASSTSISTATSTRREPTCPFPVTLAGILIVAVLTFMLTISGALGTWREMLNNAKVYDDADFDFADYIMANTPADAIFTYDFVGNTHHIRPESSLAGRQVILGYAGWLSSHGLNGWERRAALSGLMGGHRTAVTALATHNISYITVDPSSARKFDYAFLDSFADFEATSGKWQLWRVLDEVRNGSYRMRRCGYSGKGGAGEPPSRDQCIAKGCHYFSIAAPTERCVYTPYQRNVSDCRTGPASLPHFTKEACEDAGCLWFDKYPGPYCQLPRSFWNGLPVKVPTLRPGISGSDCGWSSMTPRDCEKRGCIWRQPPGDAAYAPWCVFV